MEIRYWRYYIDIDSISIDIDSVSIDIDSVSI